MKYSVLHVGVFGAVGIVLPFVVTPAGGTCFETPFRGVDGGSVEIVVPKIGGFTGTADGWFG